MSAKTSNRKITNKDIYTIIGVLFIYAFGYVCPAFGGITPMGMKMLGVLIGLIFMTCTGCNIMVSSLLALMGFVIHGYYNAATLLTTWVGSTTTFQIIFCGALCVALRKSGVMDVISKKMLMSKICKGRPYILMFMIMLSGFLVSIFIGGAPFFLLFFTMMDSILQVSGYSKDDPLYPMALLAIYVSAYGGFLFPWKGAMAITVGMFNSVLEPFGMEFDSLLYMLIQIVTWVGFDVIFVLCLKYVFRTDLSKMKALDISKIESLQQIPDKLDFNMKVSLGSLLFCVAYIMITSFLPKDMPGYATITCLGAPLIWLVPLSLFSIIRKDGKPIMNVAALAQESSLWMMIALVGSLTMLGKICTDAELGIRGWMVGLFTPLFGNMSIPMLLLLVVVFTTVVTQVVNGQVLTMGLTPVIGPIICTMILEQGVAANPSVALTVLSQSATVAFLTVSGSVNAAYLLNRKEITQKFIFTKGVGVLTIFMIWQYLVAVVMNYLFAVRV